MRIGVIIKPDVFNIYYRALGPVSALRDRGHEIEVVELDAKGRFDTRVLRTCDVVHIYRRSDPAVAACVDDLHRRGIGVTWDNDDDPRLIPRESPSYAKLGGVHAARDFQSQLKMVRRADVVTTPSPVLAETYREARTREVVQIENHLVPEQYASPQRHDGFVIGWVAGLEHRADTAALDISGTLQRVMDRHQNVRVVSLGVRLDLDPTRYTHRDGVDFLKLRDELRGFDLGIAPLSDIPMNHARSNVKVKEYAAAGVPWLASDRGPYRDLGSAQGGVLVGDDGWDAALEDLIGSRLLRWSLRRRAMAWAKSQAMARHADLWESVFERAIASASAAEGAGAPHVAVGRR